jgi:hypothetical protein
MVSKKQREERLWPEKLLTAPTVVCFIESTFSKGVEEE